MRRNAQWKSLSQGDWDHYNNLGKILWYRGFRKEYKEIGPSKWFYFIRRVKKYSQCQTCISSHVFRCLESILSRRVWNLYAAVCNVWATLNKLHAALLIHTCILMYMYSRLKHIVWQKRWWCGHWACAFIGDAFCTLISLNETEINLTSLVHYPVLWLNLCTVHIH